jgi:hypothetical protein
VLAILPLLAWGSIAYWRYLCRRAKPDQNCPPMRTAILESAVIWSLVLALATEALSFFYILVFWAVAAVWIIVALVFGALCVRLGRHLSIAAVTPPDQRSADSTSDAEVRAGFKSLLARLGYIQFAMLAVTAVIVAVVFVIAIVSPPNTWDSMTYHLSRVQHWIANGSVDHYPTHIIRQLYLSPFAEFIILHFQLLSGSDRLANMPQFLSMLGCLVGVSMIARQLGAKSLSQAFAVLVCATIPMGILQASSTQNDYVASFYLVCFVSFLLRARQNPTNWNYAFAGTALAIAFLTKTTLYLYALPFVIWMIVFTIRKLRLKAWQPAVICILLCCVVNAGYAQRNIALWGNFTGRDYDADGKSIYVNQRFGPATLVSNLVRNLAMHVTTSDMHFVWDVTLAVNNFHSWLGLDPCDPATTFMQCKFHTIELTRTDQDGLSFSNENESANPIHFLLAILAGLMLVTIRPLRANRQALIYALCIIAGMVLFCLILKWQLWCSRLHLPLFVLSAPIIAVAFAAIPNRLPLMMACVLLVCMSYTPVMGNANRPIVGQRNIFSLSRDELYFINNKALAKPYTKMANDLQARNCPKLGLVLDGDGWEYPLWVLMRERFGDQTRIRHVNVPCTVENPTGRLDELIPFTPDATIVKNGESFKLYFAADKSRQ